MIFRIVMKDKSCLFTEGESLVKIKQRLDSCFFTIATHSKTGNEEIINVEGIDRVRISHYDTLEEAVEDTINKTGEKLKRY